MTHFFHGSIFSFNVQVKLFLQFFLFHVNRVIYFIVFFKISFLSWDHMDVDVWNCLASLRTILNRKRKRRSFVILLQLYTNFLCSNP